MVAAAKAEPRTGRSPSLPGLCVCLLLTLTLSLAAGLAASAENTLYVATNGVDDTSRGTEAAPLATLNYALSQCKNQYTTILLEDGVYELEATPQVTSDGRHYDLTIRSKSGDRDKVVLDGQGKVQCLRIVSATRTRIESLTVRNGYLAVDSSTASDYNSGAGIYTYNSTATITNCVVLNCHTRGENSKIWGGGLSLNNGWPLLVDSLVDRCSASNFCTEASSSVSVLGGGVMLWGARMRNCTVRNCEVWNSMIKSSSGPGSCGGGGVYVRTSSTVEGSRFLNNRAINGYKSAGTAMGSGGGAYVSDGYVTNSLFVGNLASAMGGGVHLGGNFSLYGCTVTNNMVVADYAATYAGRGGGVIAYDTTAASSKCLEKCLIAYNTNLSTTATSPRGGGLAIDGVSEFTVRDCAIVGNRSTLAGGVATMKALATQGCKTISFTNCLFKANYSSKQGGAFYIEGTEYEDFRDCWFIENENKQNYGACGYVTTVYYNKGGGLTFRNCLFRKNVSQSGNTVFDFEPGILTYPLAMEYCTFVSNRGDVASFYTGKDDGARQWTFTGCVIADDQRRRDYPSLFWPAFYGGNNNDARFALYPENITHCACNLAANYPSGENGNLATGTDPCFIDPANGNCRPTGKSPLKAAGAAAADWMAGAQDLGAGDPVLKPVGDYGVTVVRQRPKKRLLYGTPSIGCSEAWTSPGIVIMVR